MNVRAGYENGVLKISLEGELDHHAAKKAMSEIEGQISAQLPSSCVLDLRRLSFMDSSGIAVILKSYRRMNELHGKFSVENVGVQPLKVLDAAGLDRLIGITSLAKEA